MTNSAADLAWSSYRAARRAGMGSWPALEVADEAAKSGKAWTYKPAAPAGSFFAVLWPQSGDMVGGIVWGADPLP